MPEPDPPSPLAVLMYPIALVVIGAVMIFGVATSDNLGQPLAGILTGAGALAVLGGSGLIVAWVAYRRRGEPTSRS